MLTYEEALNKAKTLKARINRCTEYNTAYAFHYDDGTDQDGGEAPVVILKSTGEALNLITFAVMPGNEVLKTFNVE